MKPDYKGLAEKYREMHSKAQYKIMTLSQSEVRYTMHMNEAVKEIAELKAKYSAAMDKIIELQEKLARITKGSDGGT